MEHHLSSPQFVTQTTPCQKRDTAKEEDGKRTHLPSFQKRGSKIGPFHCSPQSYGKRQKLKKRVSGGKKIEFSKEGERGRRQSRFDFNKSCLIPLLKPPPPALSPPLTTFPARRKKKEIIFKFRHSLFLSWSSLKNLPSRDQPPLFFLLNFLILYSSSSFRSSSMIWSRIEASASRSSDSASRWSPASRRMTST